MSGKISLEFVNHIALLASSACQASCAVAVVHTTMGVCACSEQLLHLQAAIAEFETTDFAIANNLPAHPKFSSNGLVVNHPDFVTFIGLPLTAQDGSYTGTLCVWSTIPIAAEAAGLNLLQSLAVLVGSHLIQAVDYEQLKKVNQKLAQQNENLSAFANIAAHDLRAPLNSMISLAHLLELNYGESLDEEGNEYIRFMGTAASHLSELISGIHSYSKAVDISDEKSIFRLADLVEAVIAVMRLPEHVTVRYDKYDKEINACYAALMQILIQLIDYTITVNIKDSVEISIGFAEEKDHYIIFYKDNGRGIPPAEKENIFDLFKALQKKIKGDETAVTGLAVVKKLAEKMDGAVSVTTGLDRGTEFTIRLSK